MPEPSSRDFWKWSALMFLSARCGDVVQAVVGLWLVPTFLPTSEIGSMLPISDGVTFLAVPLSVVIVTFSRQLAICSVRSALGQVKTLLRWMSVCAIVSICLMCAAALAFAPKLFTFAGVEERGVVGVIFGTGVLMALAPVFDGSLQGLRRFGTLALSGFIAAGARLAVSLLVMPVRAFTGFLLGHALAGAVRMAVSVLGLRRNLSRTLAAQPIPRTEVRAMLRFAGWLALSQGIWQFVTFVQSLIVRNNLSALDSATYFVAQRFGEVGQWAGLALLCVAFPAVAVSASDKTARLRILTRTIYGTLAAGALAALGYMVCGERLLGATAIWRSYAGASDLIVIFTLRYAMGCMVGAFVSCEQAAGNFRYLTYLAPCVLVECAVSAFLSRLDALLVWQTVTVSVQVLLVLAVVRFRRREIANL